MEERKKVRKRLLAQFDVILFDADRTLFDTAGMEAQALKKLTKQLGIPFDDAMPQNYYEINEGLWKRIETGELTREYVRVERFRRWMERYGIVGDPAEMNRKYLSIFQACNLLLPEAELVCRTLEKTKRLAIITNGTASVQRERFSRAVITPCFSDIFISEEIGVPKPQKPFFDAVLDKMNVIDPSKVLIVGDSLSSDIKGGNNAGIPTCWYNPEGVENRSDAFCDFEIHRLGELLTLK